MSTTEEKPTVGRQQVAREAPPRRFPTWAHLKDLRESRLVRSMHIWLVIVPVVAKFAARLNGVTTIQAFGSSFDLVLELPFSWQLFYFSAVSSSAGNLVYLLRCPRILRDHRHPVDFHASGKGFDQIVHYARDAGFTDDVIQQHVDNTNAEIISVEKRYNRLFWIFYDAANKARTLSLWTAAVLYVIGFGLISIVLIQNFLAVLDLLIIRASP